MCVRVYQATRRHVMRHAVSTLSTGIRMSEAPQNVAPVDSSGRATRMWRYPAIFQVFYRQPDCEWNGGQPVLLRGEAVENYTNVTTTPCGAFRCRYPYVVLVLLETRQARGPSGEPGSQA